MIGDIITIILTLLISVAIIWGSYMFSRFLGSRMGGGISAGGRNPRGVNAGGINVIERAIVGQDRYLLVVEIKGKHYLIGSADGGVTLLSELDSADWEGVSAPQPLNLNFKDVLGKFRRK